MSIAVICPPVRQAMNQCGITVVGKVLAVAVRRCSVSSIPRLVFSGNTTKAPAAWCHSRARDQASFCSSVFEIRWMIRSLQRRTLLT
jgi:hypothetical protein